MSLHCYTTHVADGLLLLEMQTLASTHLALAKKNDPGLSERFNLFVKEREHSQASESDNSGEGAKDLVSIVEFQVMPDCVLSA